MLNIKTYNILTALKNVPENELAVVEENKKVYIYSNNEWQEYKPEDGGLKISLLELNQMAVTQLPAYTKAQIRDAKKLITEYRQQHCPNSCYYMLLSNELKYYTIFSIVPEPTTTPNLENEFIDCLKHLGTIKSVALNDDGVIECWVTIDDNSYPLYFFDYTEGVIECH